MSDFRARRLPHFHAVGHPVFLTWSLHGSLPRGRSFPATTTDGKAFLVMDQLLDNAREGPLHLQMPEIAATVVDAFRYSEAILGQCEIHSYVVMANHVHLLTTPHVQISKLTQSLKRFTAKEANRILNRTGQPFWQVESYDRLVRDRTEFQRIAAYIEMNPVRAGIVEAPEEFRWSSARPIENRPQVANLPHKDVTGL